MNNAMPARWLYSILWLSLAPSAFCQAIQSPDLSRMELFPADNPWHWDITSFDIHPRNSAYLQSIGASKALHPDFGTVLEGAAWGIPYITVSASQAKVEIHYTHYGDESDPGPYPIPLSAPVEGGSSSSGDRHVIAVDTTNQILYELFHAFPKANRWDASSGAVFDLKINDHHPEKWTSADAAGLPILPGLLRYDEVYIKKNIDHAIRMTVNLSQKKYLFPARHYASSSTDLNRPPMGLRFRLKKNFDTSSFSAPNRVILRAMMKHGLIVADNGGDWFFSGAPDSRWNDDDINELKKVKGSDFEAVLSIRENGTVVTPPDVTLSIYNLPYRLGKSAGKVIQYPFFTMGNVQTRFLQGSNAGSIQIRRLDGRRASYAGTVILNVLP